MKKRIISIILSIVMLVSLLPTSALAASSSVKVGGVEMYSDSATYYVNGATEAVTEEPAYWNAKYENGTLTIKNLSVVGSGATAESAAGIYSTVDLNIVLEGANSVTAADVENASYAVYVNADLIISGKGALSATGGVAGEYCSSEGIHSDTLTVTGGVINATGGTSSTQGSYGIYVAGNELSIQGGTVVATGGTSSTQGSYGIYGITDAVSVEISGGIVVARSGSGTDTSKAIQGTLTLTSTKIAGQVVNDTFAGSPADFNENATAVAIVPSDWTVENTKRHVGDNASISIDNDTAIVVSGDNNNNGLALSLLSTGSSTITLNKDLVLINLHGTYTTPACQIGKEVTVTGSGTLTAIGAANQTYSYGITSGKYGAQTPALTVDGAKIIAIGGTASNTSYGMNCPVTITSGSVTAIGGVAATDSYGIYANTVSISGTSKVTAMGGTYGLGAKFGSLAGGSYIGGTAAVYRDSSSNVKNLLADGCGYFAGDTQLDPGSSTTVGSANQTVTVKEIPIPHVHPVCGATHTNIGDHTGTCEAVEWTALSTVLTQNGDGTYNGTLSTGNYYLDKDMTIDDSIKIKDTKDAPVSVNLCLNGHQLKGTAGEKILYATGYNRTDENAVLNICDCYDADTHPGEEYTHTYTSPISGDNKAVNGGLITGASGSNGRPVYCDDAKVTVYGGTIAGNGTGNGGFYWGAVTVAGGSFTMYGGTITDNYTKHAGAGLSGQSAEIDLVAGSITDNAVYSDSLEYEHGTGGVYVHNCATLRIHEGFVISGNRGGVQNGSAGFDSNLYLSSDASAIELVGKPGAPIGIRMESPGIFTDDYGSIDGISLSDFVSEQKGYFLTTEGEGNAAEAKLEAYAFTTQPQSGVHSVAVNKIDDVTSYSWHTQSSVTVDDTVATPYDEDAAYADGAWTGPQTSSGGQRDFFKITLEAGDTLTVTVTNPDDVSASYFSLWGSGLEAVDPDNKYASTVNFYIPVSGTYTFRVGSSSGDPKIAATLTKNGPAIDGQTTATLTDGTDRDTYVCKVTFKDGTVLVSDPVEYEAPSIPVTGVELSERSLTLDVGDTATLTATVLPDNATDKSVRWESSDPTVAKVENGVVTALKPGSTTITATTTDGSFIGTCTVTVNKIAITGTIAITTTQEPTVGQTFDLNCIVIPTGNYSRTGRAFSPSGSIEAGKDYTLSVGLMPNEGYYFADGVAATINGKTATVGRYEDDISIRYTYSFASPAANSVDILRNGDPADTASILLPGINENAATMDFTAKVLDQYGHEMTGQTVEWSITGTDTTGISVNNGTVTVTEDASEGNYTLTATCDGKSDSITIKVEKAESVLTTVKIFDGDGAGNEITTVDRTIPNVGYTLYINSAAKGYDQYGEVMTGLTFTWSNTNTDAEISLVNGDVTIGSGAQEGSFTYTATCGGKSATVTVNLTKKIYTVTYTDNVANETVFSDVQLSVQSGGTAPAYPNATPTRTGYVFAGWYTSTDGGATLSAAAYNFDTPVTGNLTLYAKWTEKATVSINDAVQTYTWNGSGKSFEISGTPNNEFTVQYKVNDNWITAAPYAVGTYNVKVTRAEDETYKAYEKTITGGLVINAAAPEATAPSAISSLVYNGSAQALVNAGSATGGTMQYKLGAASIAGEGDWSANVPAETNAGTYYVWYKVVGDSNHNDTVPGCVQVTINPKDITSATVTLGSALTYNGQEQAQTVTSVVVDSLNVTYTVSENTQTNAGSHTLTVTGTGNFTGSATKEYTIAPKEVELTWTAPGDLVYSKTEKVPTVIVAHGYLSGSDSCTVTAALTAGADNVNVTDAGFTFTASALSNTNYKLPADTQKVTSPEYTITPKQLTVTGTTVNATKVYDGNKTTAVDNNGTLDGVCVGDTVTHSATATYADKNVGENKTVTVVYAISGTNAGNYIKPADNTSLTAAITQKQLEVSGTTVSGKTYDRNTTASVSPGTLTNAENGDVVTLSATATYADENVGENKQVTVVYTISGDDAANYLAPVDNTSLTATITAKQLTATGTTVAATKVYDSYTTAAVTANGTLDGVESGDTVTFGTVTATYDSKDVGIDKQITVKYTISGADAGNYIAPVNNTSLKAAITPKPITAQWTVTSKVYDGTAQGPGYTLLGVCDGDTIAVTNTKTDAGSYQLIATLDSANYTLTNPNVNFVIEKAPVTFTVADDSQQYDGSTKTATITAKDNNGNNFTAFSTTYKNSRGETVAQPTAVGNYGVYVKITNDNYRHADAADGAERKIGTLSIYQTSAPATYTVSFDGNSATGGSTATLDAAKAGDTRILPNCGFTKDGWTFTGWKYGDKVYKAGESFIQPAANVTFTAQWTKNVYTVGGIVKNYSDAVQEGAVVTLMSGARQVEQKTTGADGKFNFTNVLPGLYNLVVSYDGKTVTSAVEITNANETDLTVKLPDGKTNSVVEVAAGTPEVIVDGLEKSFANTTGNYTNEDVTIVNNGGSVEFKLTVSEISVPEEAKQTGLAKKSSNEFLYLDMDLSKTTITDEGSTTTPLYSSDPLLEITVPVPADIQGKDSYQVYRYHKENAEADEELTQMKQLSGTDTPMEEGYRVSQDKTTVTVYTRSFSLYAITYQQYSGGGSSSYAVTVESAKNGTVSADKKSTYSGSTVTITVTPDKGFTLETLTVTDKNGKEVEVKNLGNNKFSFKMPSGNVSISATFMEDNTMLNFFVDVKATDYFYDAVLWAAENDITKGTDAVHFSPNLGVTRAQVVTFLWRASGCPEPTGNASKFTDVVIGSYYEKAVAWAIEQGITKGTSDTTFSPDKVCTRGQIVTFLARFAGVEDEATGYTHGFTDVKATDYFNNAVAWAKDNKVTEGTSKTTFSPNTDCTRAQVVTFIYRYVSK